VVGALASALDVARLFTSIRSVRYSGGPRWFQRILGEQAACCSEMGIARQQAICNRPRLIEVFAGHALDAE
jgi:hypothetical protein